MPTVLAAAGVDAQTRLDGENLALFLGPDSVPHPVSYAETGKKFFPQNKRRYVNGIEGNWLSLREGDWKLIKIPTPSDPIYELYHLVDDPRETTNRFDPAHEETQRLMKALDDWVAGFESRPAHSGEPDEIDPEVQERLRSLGYVE